MNLDFYFPEWLEYLNDNRTHYENILENTRADVKEESRLWGPRDQRDTKTLSGGEGLQRATGRLRVQGANFDPSS